MLVNLHVKNFALIDEIDVDFNEHLNILTGETGAGKSILVGSINIALGGRVSSEMIRKGADYALVELVFLIRDTFVLKRLEELEVFPEEGQIVISRRIMANRSVNKINGENVSVSTIRQVAEVCIDIHGQHEHQSLLHKSKHLEIVDAFAEDSLHALLEQLGTEYESYREVTKQLEDMRIPKEERDHQISFLEYEKNEIESAGLKEGEEEDLQDDYSRMKNAGTIVETLSRIYDLTGDGSHGISNLIGKAVKDMTAVTELDDRLSQPFDELLDIEGLTNDFNRELSDYMSQFQFDDSEFAHVEQRLDLVRTLYSRYGGDYIGVMSHLEEVKGKLERYQDYDEFMQKNQIKLDKYIAKMQNLSDKISTLRKQSAAKLEKEITKALLDLNFEQVNFHVQFNEKSQVGRDGADDVEFLISTNPGEPLMPLGKVASGGELSRIMLAVKSVLAGRDQIETLIFDEIDVGISGRTAQKVSEKMSVIGREHQVICITHLAQIAAMADTHYRIEKKSSENITTTCIVPLSQDESVEELARMLGGAKITEAVLENAREMKELALQTKNYCD